MLIFSAKGKITVDNDKTNLIHYFDMQSGIKQIKINYTYSPKTIASRENSAAIIRNCFDKYDEVILGKPGDYMPIKNLITLSVDENGKYRGTAHKQANEQEHIIGSDFASPGFTKRAIEAGEWDIMLNVHYVGCDVDYTISVEGEVE